MAPDKIKAGELLKFLIDLSDKMSEQDFDEAYVLIMKRNGKSRFVDRLDFRFHPRTDKLPESQVLVIYECDH
jgi:hypothetical protein